MSRKERVRLDAMHRVQRGELTVTASAGLMELSVRQALRLWKRFKTHGSAGLVHALRGRAGNRRLPQELRERIVKRYVERYGDFGPTLACEKLAQEGMVISADTLTALLKERQVWVRRRRRGRHRQRRERRASFGMMIQMDGSHHDWFEGRGEVCVLMVVIDDATNDTFARLYGAETTVAAFDVFGRWVKRYGVPRSVYVDRHGIYRDEEHPEKPTQFGRAMGELGVKLICARSPQAKGRVERRNAVFQDRLVKEMRLRGISEMAQGNALLEKFFLADLNRRYAVAPRHSADLHRTMDPGLVLEEVLCVQDQRVVGKDWCIRWQNQWLQLAAGKATAGLSGKRVLVKQLGSGTLVITHGGQVIGHKRLASRPAAARVKPVVVSNRPWKPGANHPWKREGIGREAWRARPAAAAPPRAVHAGDRTL